MAIKVEILGFGSFGQAAIKLLSGKQEMVCVALADQKGYAYAPDGIYVMSAIADYENQGSVGYLECGVLSDRLRDAED